MVTNNNNTNGNTYDFSTYTSGYRLVATKQFKLRDLQNACDDLSAQFEGITFSPEGITEGGIVLKSPGWSKDAYKSFRIWFDKWNDYPWIYNDPLLNDYDTVLLNAPSNKCANHQIHEQNGYFSCEVVPTFLKSFGDAPAWTHEELSIVHGVLRDHGLKRACKSTKLDLKYKPHYF